MTRTYLSVSEKTDHKKHKSHYILHNGWEWYHADFDNKSQMDKLLEFFECEIVSTEKTTESPETGKVTYYNLSKDIISRCGGGFWNIEQVVEQANGKRIKSFLGLSNGFLTVCYAIFDDNNNTVEVVRPNPNARQVYITMPFGLELQYMKNQWYM